MDGGRCTNQSRTRTSRGERQKYRDRVHLERRIARLSERETEGYKSGVT